MTATLNRPAPSCAGSAPQLRRRRPSRVLMLAAVLTVAGGLLGVYAYRGAVDRQSVVAIARTVPFGTVVQQTDLREALLPSGTGLSIVPWEAADSVIGLTATTDLRAGQTLTPDGVAAQGTPAPGEAVVGLSVNAGRIPSSPLDVRDEILIIHSNGRPPQRATVLSAGDVDVSGRRTVDVLVAATEVEALALVSNDDEIAIVLVGRG